MVCAAMQNHVSSENTSFNKQGAATGASPGQKEYTHSACKLNGWLDTCGSLTVLSSQRTQQ